MNLLPLIEFERLLRNVVSAYRNTQVFSYTDDRGKTHRFSVQAAIDHVWGSAPTLYPVSKLQPADGTRILRTHQARIERADTRYPVIIDPGFSASRDRITHGYVDGIPRVLRAQQLGLKTLPVHFIDIDQVPELDS